MRIRINFHNPARRMLRPLVPVAFALGSFVLAQAEDPGTWLRVLELPVFSGPVAAAEFMVTDVTEPHSPRLLGHGRWVLNEHNLPVRARTHYGWNSLNLESAVTEWTWTGELLPQTVRRFTAGGMTTSEFTRTGPNALTERLRTRTRFTARSHEVFPAERTVVTTSFEFNAPFRRITSFAPDWQSARRVSEVNLGEGYWHSVTEAEFDSSGVLQSHVSGAGDIVRTVYRQDRFGNPLEASYVHYSIDGTFHYGVGWHYTYHDGDSAGQ